MSRTLTELKRNIDRGTGNKVDVHDDIVHSIGDYKSHLDDITGVDFKTGKPKSAAHKAIEKTATELERAERDLERSSPALKSVHEAKIERLTDKLEDLVHDNSQEFKDVLEANRDARLHLAEAHTETARELAEHIENKSTELADLIEKNTSHDGKLTAFEFEGKKINTTKEAENTISALEKRAESATRGLESAVTKADRAHGKIEKAFERVAEKVEKKTGKNLMEEVGKSEKGFLESAKTAVHDAKGKGRFNFVKVATLIGAAVLGGHGLSKVLSPESTGTDKTVGFVEVAGGGGLAYAGLKMASHARL